MIRRIDRHHPSPDLSSPYGLGYKLHTTRKFSLEPNRLDFASALTLMLAGPAILADAVTW